jgi:hypothetical protein
MKNENSKTSNEETQASAEIRELSVAELEHVGGGTRVVGGYIGLPIRPETSVD